jgi:hypothetical protein
MSKQCKFKCGDWNCGSYQFNLYKNDIDQGDLCDVHYWQTKAQRPWVGLTDEEIKTILSQIYCDINQMKLTLGEGPQKETVGFLFAKGIEQVLKEKNT